MSKKIPPPAEITKKLMTGDYNGKDLAELFDSLFWWVFRGPLGIPGPKHEVKYAADKTISLTFMKEEKKNVIALSSFKLLLTLDGKNLRGIVIRPAKKEDTELAENIARRLNELFEQGQDILPRKYGVFRQERWDVASVPK